MLKHNNCIPIFFLLLFSKLFLEHTDKKYMHIGLQVHRESTCCIVTLRSIRYSLEEIGLAVVQMNNSVVRILSLL